MRQRVACSARACTSTRAGAGASCRASARARTHTHTHTARPRAEKCRACQLGGVRLSPSVVFRMHCTRTRTRTRTHAHAGHTACGNQGRATRSSTRGQSSICAPRTCYYLRHPQASPLPSQWLVPSRARFPCRSPLAQHPVQCRRRSPSRSSTHSTVAEDSSKVCFFLGRGHRVLLGPDAHDSKGTAQGIDLIQTTRCAARQAAVPGRPISRHHPPW